ncbi:MAG: SRPBCC family protein [Streptosporangiaceae bacterium]
MLTRTFTVDTRADVATVGGYLADFRHHRDWRDDVIVSEVETGEPGHDGTIYRQHVHQGPSTAWRRLRATVSEDARRIEFHTLEEAPAVASGSYEIEPRGAGTTVHCTIGITFHGTGHALRPIVQRSMDGRLESYSRALTSQLDQLATSDESVG